MLVRAAWALVLWWMSGSSAWADDPAYLQSLHDEVERRALWRAPEWRKLGHYRGKLWGRRSQADGRSFFASPSGNVSPRRELHATLDRFFDPPVEPSEDDPTAQHPQCRWRARYEWLSVALDVDPERLVPVACDRYQEWRERLDVASVTLVYADAYLGNPASMFGHTFLRLDRDLGGVEGSALVANTVEFAAVPWTTNPLLYPILGLGGGFAGRYSTAPYYLKVRQYSSMEDRDLWEYPLQFDDAERDRLMAHLWEMGGVPFMYYYLKENCSYHLLGQMEVARPSLELLDRFPFIAFPISTVRAVVDQQGLVGKGVLRPSAWRELSAERRALAPDQRSVARRLARRAAPESLAALGTLPPAEAAATLDAAVDLLRYRLGDAEPRDRTRATESALLTARGALGVASEPLIVAPRKPPEAGHRAAMVALSGGASESGPFARATLRPALHDLLARPDGYVDGSALEMMGVTLRAQPTPYLERLGVFSTTSILPVRPWRVRPSWRVAITGAADRAGGCVGHAGCFRWTGAAGIGTAVASAEAARVGLGAYGFLDGAVNTGSGAGIRLGPRLGAGLLGRAGGLRLWAEALADMPLLQVQGLDVLEPVPGLRGDGGLAVPIHADAEIRVGGRAGQGFTEGDVGLQVTW